MVNKNDGRAPEEIPRETSAIQPPAIVGDLNDVLSGCLNVIAPYSYNALNPKP